MNSGAFCGLAGRLMRQPAAPYHEHAVSAEVQKVCTENGLHCKKDPFGNLVVRAWERRRLGGKSRPIVFAAHMDHPGFEVLPLRSRGRLRVRFQGGAQRKGKRKDFQFQRALMSGGTCEATAYQEYGYQTGAVCVALGNYHNCADRNRIAAEFVNTADACSMVELLIETARRMPQFNKVVRALPKRLERLRREGLQQLRATA